VVPDRQGETPSAGGYVLAVHPGLLYRRRVPAVPGTRRQLRLVAQDLFPFDPDSTRYAASRGADGGQCWAIRDDRYARLTEQLPAPLAVIVAQPDADSLTQALMGRLRSAVADLLDAPVYLLPPAPIVATGLVGVCLLLAVVGYGRWQDARQAQLAALESELQRLQTQTAPVREKRAALVRMNAAYSALSELENRPGAAALTRLYALMESMPAETRIDEVTFADGRLRVSGLSNAASSWARAAGVAPANLDIATRPKIDRFTFDIPVGPADGDS
jgi:hypothetical protein